MRFSLFVGRLIGSNVFNKPFLVRQGFECKFFPFECLSFVRGEPLQGDAIALEMVFR